MPERDPPPDNRWQRGEVVDALYLADSEETAWAEWYRHLAERAIPPLAQMPRELWEWQVDVEVADLSTDEKLAAVELEPPAPGSDGWRAYQLVGEQISAERWLGLLAPSAARRPARSSACSETSAAWTAPRQVLPHARFATRHLRPRGW
jgi:RES domain-containing protein